MAMYWNMLMSDARYHEDSADAAECGEVTYENDYDTIISSTLFRRLQDKAQVFPLEEDDYVRTRLTHSLEVSAIGKKLGEHVFRKLRDAGADEWFDTHSEKDFSDVLLCAGLVHDIGNPPFGHFGEYAIREWFQNNISSLKLKGVSIDRILTDEQLGDLYNFEGNAQSLRILSATPYLGTLAGFNLSYAVLAAIIKYPVSSVAVAPSSKYRKFGYNTAEKALFDDISSKTGMNGSRHPLSYLLEAADDIAYRTSDIEDAMVKKVISYSQIEASLEVYAEANGYDDMYKNIGILKELCAKEIGSGHRNPELTALQMWNKRMKRLMIEEASDSFVKNYDAIINGTFEGGLFENTSSGHIIGAISQLSEQMIYTSPVKIKTELFGRRVIESLLGQFMPAAVRFDTDDKMTFIDCRTIDIISGFYKSMYKAQSDGRDESEKLYLRILMVTDYISGMTDSYAKRLYNGLFV